MKLSYSNYWGKKKTPTVVNALRIAGVKKKPSRSQTTKKPLRSTRV